MCDCLGDKFYPLRNGAEMVAETSLGFFQDRRASCHVLTARQSRLDFVQFSDRMRSNDELSDTDDISGNQRGFTRFIRHGRYISSLTLHLLFSLLYTVFKGDTGTIRSKTTGRKWLGIDPEQRISVENREDTADCEGQWNGEKRKVGLGG